MIAHRAIWNAALDNIATAAVLGFSETENNICNEWRNLVQGEVMDNDDYCMMQLFFALMLGSEHELETYTSADGVTFYNADVFIEV